MAEFHALVTRLILAARPYKEKGKMVGALGDVGQADFPKLAPLLQQYKRLGSLVRILASDPSYQLHRPISELALSELVAESCANLNLISSTNAKRVAALGSEMSKFPVMCARPADIRKVNEQLKRAAVGEGWMVRDPRSRQKRDNFSVAAEELIVVLAAKRINLKKLAQIQPANERKRRWEKIKPVVNKKHLLRFLQNCSASPLPTTKVAAMTARTARSWGAVLLEEIDEPERPLAKRRYRVREKLIGRIETMLGLRAGKRPRFS